MNIIVKIFNSTYF